MTKIKWKLANSKIIEIAVTDAQAVVLIELKRQSESYERKFKRRATLEKSLDYLHDEYEWVPKDDTVDVQSAVEREEDAERIRWAMAYLTEKQRLLVRLHFYEGKQFCEIAAMLGVSKSAITQQFKTIYSALKKILEN